MNTLSLCQRRLKSSLLLVLPALGTLLGSGAICVSISEPTVAQETKPAEEVFSGPQVGEDLSAFEIVGVFDDAAGKRFDPIAEAKGKPLVLLFVHQANRPSIGLTRLLMTYLEQRQDNDVASCVVWLSADPTQAESDLKRMRHALPAKTLIGISPDGVEGPGTYGLNRQVTVTVLVGKENKVTANYALIQPSIQADLPKIFQSIVDIAGGEVPDVNKLQVPGMRPNATGNNPNQPNEALAEQVRTFLRPVIKKDATDEQVDEAAAAVEAWVEKDEAARKEIARISKTIVNSGKLENYGTPRCQEILRKWAEKYQ